MNARIPKVAGLVVVAASVMLAGCSSSRNTVTVHESTQITKGRELSDLRKALEAQAVTREEYETLRRVIMDRRN